MNEKDKTELLVKTVLLHGDINIYTLIPICVEKAFDTFSNLNLKHTSYSNISNRNVYYMIKKRAIKLYKNALKKFSKKELSSYFVSRKENHKPLTKSQLINIIVKKQMNQVIFDMMTYQMKKRREVHEPD